jgi:hypothetical protein
MSEIENGPPMIVGIDFTLGRPGPVDLRLAFNTLSDEEFDEAFSTSPEVEQPLPCSCGQRFGRMRTHRDDCGDQ